jgi:hypothetical protein
MKPWVRIASSVLSARGLLPFSKPLAESTLEAMRTQVVLTHYDPSERAPVD